MNSPAPINSSSESATCATTSALRNRDGSAADHRAGLVLQGAGEIRAGGLQRRHQAEEHAGETARSAG